MKFLLKVIYNLFRHTNSKVKMFYIYTSLYKLKDRRPHLQTPVFQVSISANLEEALLEFF